MQRDFSDQGTRYELAVEGHIVFADYGDHQGMRLLPHVEAPPALRGQGAAGRLMLAIAQDARERGLKLRPICSYAAAWFARHPDWADVLA